jgi:hypothetical protein
VPTVKCRVLFVFIMLAHERRCIVHFNITEHPTAQLDGATDCRGLALGYGAGLPAARPGLNLRSYILKAGHRQHTQRCARSCHRPE